MGDFSGRAALVTGGSRGVGRAIASWRRAAPTSPSLYNSRREAAERLATEIESLGGRSLALQAEVGASSLA